MNPPVYPPVYPPVFPMYKTVLCFIYHPCWALIYYYYYYCLILLIIVLLFQHVRYYYFITLSLLFYHRKTVIMFDSRGRHILVEDPSIVSCTCPGATLSSIGHKAEEMIMRHSPISCLIIVGVNDLTRRDMCTRKVSVLISDPFLLANYVINKILQLRSRLLRFWPGIRLAFAGITGIDLNRYNRLSGLSDQQWIIDDCLLQVNSYIRILNRFDGNYHPRLTSKVHIWRKGLRINRYHLLDDGLHPGPIVIHSWIRAITRFHRINTLGLNN